MYEEHPTTIKKGNSQISSCTNAVTTDWRNVKCLCVSLTKRMQEIHEISSLGNRIHGLRSNLRADESCVPTVRDQTDPSATAPHQNLPAAGTSRRAELQTPQSSTLQHSAPLLSHCRSKKEIQHRLVLWKHKKIQKFAI